MDLFRKKGKMPLDFGGSESKSQGKAIANTGIAQVTLVPVATVTLNDVIEGLKMFRVDQSERLQAIPEEKIGNLYAGDSYVMFCSYEVGRMI